ncbi:hypothetical protein [Novosphingobium sp. 9U]|uniref:hypothetical protein n=1 Tax=Novosphingobium sp. 9U TaxID=2653158 RepID=UPI0012F22815|nr:hypothetical protein [Novosphingobium sp. 9U]VWX52904.1 hypothetical protein NOVOSPHI9U_420147 [Novosphingobium sp. 9U]
MYDLTEGAVLVVAQGVRDTVDSLDSATETTLRTFADAVAGLRGSGLPADKVQQVHEDLIDALVKARDARKSVLKAARCMAAILHRSTQRELDVGCPIPWAKITFAPSNNSTASSEDAT